MGRVGMACGPSWPDQAPAQFTIFSARKDVLVVVTPVAWSSERLIAVTGSAEEKSTPRIFAVLRAAAVSARGSTLRSFRKNAGWPEGAREGSRLARAADESVAGWLRCSGDGKTIVPWSRRSTFIPDSVSSSCANSGYMLALAVASDCSTGL